LGVGDCYAERAFSVANYAHSRVYPFNTFAKK